jgi:hypothetical protein
MNDFDMLLVICFIMFLHTFPYRKVGYTGVVIVMWCYSL